MKATAVRHITTQVFDDAHQALKLVGIVESKLFASVCWMPSSSISSTKRPTSAMWPALRPAPSAMWV